MTRVASTARRSHGVSLDLDSPELAATYDKVNVRQFNHGKVLIGSLRVKPGERVLDVGCSTGRLGTHVAGLVAPLGEVVAQPGRADDLSAFEDESFDVAYLNSVFHWVADKPRALREARRVLKRGGRVGVNSADADRSHQGAALVREAILEEGLSQVANVSALSSNYRVNAQQLLWLLRDAGFVDVQVTAHTFVDEVAGADDLFVWSSRGSIGHVLSDLTRSERCRVRERLTRKLEALRAPDHRIRMERYLVFATAKNLNRIPSQRPVQAMNPPNSRTSGKHCSACAARGRVGRSVRDPRASGR